MTSSYFDELVKLKCGPDLLALQVFPNAKEITESFGAFNAVRNYVCCDKIKLSDPNIDLFVVGDGVSPRTAATFAFRSGWNCYSIDPIMRIKEYPVKRLTLYAKKIEELNFETDNIAIIVMVHSHAKLKDTLLHIKSKQERHLVTIPCCVPHEMANKPYLGYMDSRILSEKNTVKIWRNI
jgi:hypothetical protein